MKTCPSSIAGRMNLQRKVSIRVLICAPSMSASHIIMIFEYRSLVVSNAPSSSSLFPTPAPRARMMVCISWFWNTFAALCFCLSTLRIFPLRGVSLEFYDPFQFSLNRQQNRPPRGKPHIRLGLEIDSRQVCLANPLLPKPPSFE